MYDKRLAYQNLTYFRSKGKSFECRKCIKEFGILIFRFLNMLIYILLQRNSLISCCFNGNANFKNQCQF